MIRGQNAEEGEMAPTAGAGLMEGAKRLCSLHHCAVAVAFWEQAACLKPSDPGIHYQLGFCHAGCSLARPRDPEIALYHYRRALALEPRDNSLARARVWAALGDTYWISSGRSRARLLTSLDCLERAARIFRELGRFDDWAREQFNIANAWCEMPEGEFPGKWEKAIEHYERALEVRTRQKDPERYAATVQNLGTACRELKTGDPATHSRRAVDCYHQALRALRGRGSHRKLADLHHNLGNAYLNLAAGEKAGLRNLHRALRHLARALAVRATLPSLFDHAATQFSRGQVYLQLALRGADEDANLDAARACLADAQEGFALSGHPELAQAVQAYLDRVAGALPRAAHPPTSRAAA
jgi:tetratricopeptide (TPR) repeat protein